MTPPPPAPSPGTTRRRVVKTGAHLAWSTPVILAASSLPAHGVAASGAPVIVTGEPSFTIPPSHVRASTVLRNTGTVAPSEMTVTIQIVPIQGSLEGRKPTVLGTDFSFMSWSRNVDTGVHTATFRKNDPQIAPGTSTTLRFDFYAIASELDIKQGTVTVSPSVAAPGTATPNGNDYLSTVNPDA